jgi:metal-responsive CopG/Arc/MetJ family transcriptional regulator
MALVPIAIRLEETVINDIDTLIIDYGDLTRTDFIRDAITHAIERGRQRRIDRAIVDGYTRLPETAEERAWATGSFADWSAEVDADNEAW